MGNALHYADATDFAPTHYFYDKYKKRIKMNDPCAAVAKSQGTGQTVLFSRPRRAAGYALLIGTLLTFFLAGQLYRLETDKLNNLFTRRAEFRIRLFEQSIHQAEEKLRNVNQLFATSRTAIDQEQFREVATALLAQQTYIRSFVFHRYVAPGDRASFEADMGTVQPGFHIHHVLDGQLRVSNDPGPWLVVTHYAPLLGNELVLGFDAFSDPQHRRATEQAIATGKVTASEVKQAVLKPRERGVEGQVFALVMPLYRRGAAVDTAAARRQALEGETMAGFHAQSFAQQVFQEAGFSRTPDLSINIYAAPIPSDAALIFRQGAAPPALVPTGPMVSLLCPDRIITLSRNVDFAGRQWLIVISNATPHLADAHLGSLMALAGGCIVTLLSAAFVKSLIARAQSVERQVVSRTAQLQSATCELQLRNSAIEASANAIFITGAQGPDYLVEYVNPAFTHITGYAPGEIMGRSFRLLDRAEENQTELLERDAAMHAGREFHAVVRSYGKDGTMYWNDIHVSPVRDDTGHIRHFVHLNYDVTDTKRYQEQLEIRANFDTLTGLANRNLLQDRLRQAVSTASRSHRKVWLAFIDLDRFKFVNDSAGHRYGDVVLQVVAGRINAAVGMAHTVARMGGDEFVMVLPQYDDDFAPLLVIDQVIAGLALPIEVDGKEFFVSCSIGIAVYPADGANVETLLMHADVAMYRAKEMGGNTYQFFEPELNNKTHLRLRLESALRHALARHELLLHYQPQVNLDTGAIVGMEALLRWQHQEFGMVGPGDFVPLAEKTGLINPIGAWVLHTACAQTVAWQAAGLGKVRIAVNLSGIQFAQRDIVQTVAGALAETGLDPACLEIELTETIVMQDIERTVRTLHQLKALGVKISLDDFGTGYSSLAYLKRFPIDVLKIDQSFVRDVATMPDDAMIVVSIITLAHNLRLQVIAEGVETPEQLTFLRENTCDEIQGYYFSRPLAGHAVAALLQEGRCLDASLCRPAGPAEA